MEPETTAPETGGTNTTPVATPDPAASAAKAAPKASKAKAEPKPKAEPKATDAPSTASKAPKAGQTVGDKALTDIGRKALKNNPTLAAVFVTGDGVAFAAESDARNHASTLTDKNVVSVNKADKSDE